MDFLTAINNSEAMVTEGAVIERLKREYGVELDPYIANAGFIYDPRQRKLLTSIYRQYIDITFEHGLPMLLFTPTWRANGERIKQANMIDKDVNLDCYNFMAEIRDSYGEYAKKIYVGGLVGCKGDAYKPEEALLPAAAEEFHLQQIECLVKAGVDFLIADTMPAVSEAMGLAKGMSRTHKPYIISFVIRNHGALLDGTPLSIAIEMIDSEVDPKPIGYTVNCVHPTIFKEALLSPINACLERRRMLGLMANTSAKSPEELDNAMHLETEEPEIWAREMIALHREMGMKIMGGCCGTNHHHIQSLVNKIIT